MIEFDILKKEYACELAKLDKKCFTIPWSQKSFENEAENEFASYIVAKDNQKCIGYCGFWRTYDEGDITNVAVSPSYRRQGIGAMLVSQMIKRAIQMNLKSMSLEVRKSNLAAQKLYEKFGFEVIGERKRYYSDNNEDALIMLIKLDKEE